MYYLLLEGHKYSYEIYEILTLYYPGEKITVCESRDTVPDDCRIINSIIKLENDAVFSECSLLVSEKQELREIKSFSQSFEMGEDLKRTIKHAVKVTLFNLLKDVTGLEMPWGILVGIRPSKIVNDLKSGNTGEDLIRETLKEKYLLRPDKAELVLEVSDNSYKLINNDKRKVSIYVGVPFCPTRCVYCSFASYPMNKFGQYVSGYMESIRYEIESLSTFIKDNFTVDTIYVGGGTPTSIDDMEFKALLETIEANFYDSSVKEFTVEAGRPDTISKFKLESMAESKVSRISINPQSMNEETLKAIGRDHSVQDIIDKFTAARECGFDNINMDIILGLPGEEVSHVKHTISEIIKLSPENVTVHTMAVKRASRLKEKIIEGSGHIGLPDMMKAGSMMDYVHHTLTEEGYKPYYMYRQKQMVGNLENVGYCKPGFECLYNIQMIEEKETIIGFGPDSVTKLVFHDENRIERFANKKDIKEYVNTISDNCDRKLEFLKLLT